MVRLVRCLDDFVFSFSVVVIAFTVFILLFHPGSRFTYDYVIEFDPYDGVYVDAPSSIHGLVSDVINENLRYDEEGNGIDFDDPVLYRVEVMWTGSAPGMKFRVWIRRVDMGNGTYKIEMVWKEFPPWIRRVKIFFNGIELDYKHQTIQKAGTGDLHEIKFIYYDAIKERWLEYVYRV